MGPKSGGSLKGNYSAHEVKFDYEGEDYGKDDYGGAYGYLVDPASSHQNRTWFINPIQHY